MRTVVPTKSLLYDSGMLDVRCLWPKNAGK